MSHAALSRPSCRRRAGDPTEERVAFALDATADASMLGDFWNLSCLIMRDLAIQFNFYTSTPEAPSQPGSAWGGTENGAKRPKMGRKSL